MPPVNEVGRSRDLDVDPFPAAKRLSRIGIIESIRREDDGRIGEVGVEDGVAVATRQGCRDGG